ncbi:MAG: TIGR00725 family protein [FCB group bacterium]|nr:TIGR00725 family protein [FCB group bacterium]
MTFAGRIAVFGGRKVTAEILARTEELGRELGRRNYLVFCGGGEGVMEAISQGVSQSGGTVVGILKGNSITEANPHITIPVLTNMGITRNALLALNCDLAIAISGKYGTLSEIAYAFQLNKPVIGFHTWDIEGIQSVATVSEVIHRVTTFFSNGSKTN